MFLWIILGILLMVVAYLIGYICASIQEMGEINKVIVELNTREI